MILVIDQGKIVICAKLISWIAIYHEDIVVVNLLKKEVFSLIQVAIHNEMTQMEFFFLSQI